jgi:ubiquinone/menaquinone biosynthesis C-methylase UbiE
MEPLYRWYPEARFGGFTDLDGTLIFYNRARALVPPGGSVADVGCGRGAHHDDPVAWRREVRTLRGWAGRVVGIDVDPDAAGNPRIDEFRLMDPSGQFPLEDASVDLLVSDFVLEHVQDPTLFFAECHRVLRPGGHVALRTTNAHGYVALAARLIPNRHHSDVVKLSPEGREPQQDVFPTVYACNTRRRLRRALADSGFDAVVYGFEAEPRYFAFSRFLYMLGVLHQRFAPSALRVSLVAFGRKPA